MPPPRLAFSDEPGNLLVTGGFLSVFGGVLMHKAWTGDTLVPGTLWTRVPRWGLWVAGLACQIPLPVAYWFLKSQGLM